LALWRLDSRQSVMRNAMDLVVCRITRRFTLLEADERVLPFEERGRDHVRSSRLEAIATPSSAYSPTSTTP
jgi:hypothetical protein